jgi:hypothetical protein
MSTQPRCERCGCPLHRCQDTHGEWWWSHPSYSSAPLFPATPPEEGSIDYYEYSKLLNPHLLTIREDTKMKDFRPIPLRWYHKLNWELIGLWTLCIVSATWVWWLLTYGIKYSIKFLDIVKDIKVP